MITIGEVGELGEWLEERECDAEKRERDTYQSLDHFPVSGT